MEDGSDDGRELGKKKVSECWSGSARKKGLRRIYSAPKAWKINSWGVLKNPIDSVKFTCNHPI